MGSLIRLPERSTNRTEAYFDTSAETAPRPEAIRKLPASISEQLVAATQTGNVLNQIIDAVQRHIDSSTESLPRSTVEKSVKACGTG